MPKLGLISTSDIYWGMSTFTRINRLDPSTNVTREMINARHVPFSSIPVSASNVAGALDDAYTGISGVVLSNHEANKQAISGVVLSNYEANKQAVSGIVLSNYEANKQAISGIVLSNYAGNVSNIYDSQVAISGILLSNDLSRIQNVGVTGSGWRLDAGLTGFSGWIQQSVSTGLSTVNYATATQRALSGGYYTLGMGAYSGKAVTAEVQWSGHVIDLYKYAMLSGSYLTSAGTSSQVSWMATGV